MLITLPFCYMAALDISYTVMLLPSCLGTLELMLPHLRAIEVLGAYIDFTISDFSICGARGRALQMFFRGSAVQRLPLYDFNAPDGCNRTGMQPSRLRRLRKISLNSYLASPCYDVLQHKSY